MISDLIHVDTGRCVGCNRCISVCPLEETNIAFFEENRARVRLDELKCIRCGACLEVCCHQSRLYADDSGDILSFLRRGEPFVVLAAPSIRVNFRDTWERVLGTFRQLGALGVYDVSLGADICTWAHLRWLEQNGRRSLITQPCPVVVNYITKYRQDLIELLSPVHSPVLCTAIFLQKYLGIHAKILFLSPCVAKADEFRLTGLDAFNLTFRSLQQMFENKKLTLSDEPSGFDSVESGMGRIFSRPGGLKENLEAALGTELTIHRVEGTRSVYRYLDGIRSENRDLLPDILDVLNCESGCNFGTGCENTNTPLAVNHWMDEEKRRSLEKYPLSGGRSPLYDACDRSLRLEDFLRVYEPEPAGEPRRTMFDTERAFALLGKSTFEDRNYNCGACGSSTCGEMADKIAKGLNIPENCLWKTRHDLTDETRRVAEVSRDLTLSVSDITEKLLGSVRALNEKNKDMTAFVHDIGEIAFTTRILSLNAGIEAVHAGKAGQGFAVLAEEIRRLADSSAEASGKIEKAVEENDAITNSVVESITAVESIVTELHEKIAALSE